MTNQQTLSFSSFFFLFFLFFFFFLSPSFFSSFFILFYFFPSLSFFLLLLLFFFFTWTEYLLNCSPLAEHLLITPSPHFISFYFAWTQAHQLYLKPNTPDPTLLLFFPSPFTICREASFTFVCSSQPNTSGSKKGHWFSDGVPGLGLLTASQLEITASFTVEG